jgi:hypothetical protein
MTCYAFETLHGTPVTISADECSYFVQKPNVIRAKRIDEDLYLDLHGRLYHYSAGDWLVIGDPQVWWMEHIQDDLYILRGDWFERDFRAITEQGAVALQGGAP